MVISYLHLFHADYDTCFFVESFGDSSGLWLPPGESAPKGGLDGQVWEGLAEMRRARGRKGVAEPGPSSLLGLNLSLRL